MQILIYFLIMSTFNSSKIGNYFILFILTICLLLNYFLYLRLIYLNVELQDLLSVVKEQEILIYELSLVYTKLNETNSFLANVLIEQNRVGNNIYIPNLLFGILTLLFRLLLINLRKFVPEPNMTFLIEDVPTNLTFQVSVNLPSRRITEILYKQSDTDQKFQNIDILFDEFIKNQEELNLAIINIISNAFYFEIPLECVDILLGQLFPKKRE